MEKDPTELTDLSSVYPKRKQQMYDAWKQWAESIGVFPVDTRDYGERQRAYKRIINGEFDDNFGDWDIICHPDAHVDFIIDTVNVISGRKTARIDVIDKGERPASALLKWTMNLRKGETVDVSFAAKANQSTNLIFRIERVNNPQLKSLDETIPLTTTVKDIAFQNIAIEENGNYQFVFYVGTMDGTCWIDRVNVNFYE